MSDSSHPALRAKLAEAIALLNTASGLISEVSAALEDPVGRPVTQKWEVVEQSRLPFPDSFASIRASFSCCGLETGPPETPACALTLGNRCLSGAAGGAAKAVDRAFRAGFWAHISIATYTPYEPLTKPPHHTPAHWICLIPHRLGASFRTHTLWEIEVINSCEQAAIEGFSTFSEVEIFCAGAACPIPPLRVYRE